MGAIVAHLRDAFATMYEKYSTGRDKYLQFQMEWHKYCSAFLLSNTDLSSVGIDPSVHVELAKIQERWIGYCQGKSAELNVRNAVMISVCSAVYDHLLNYTNSIIKAITEENFATSQIGNSSITVDDTSVYYRFCGAALAEMLHARYRKRESCKPCQKESIAREIKILQAIRCKDKAHVPPELQY